MLHILQAGSLKGDPNDSDDDMVLGSIEFTLRCPLTGSRIKTPARFAGVPGLTAFDLDAFVGMVKRSKKWQCPHSMRNLPVQDLMCDGYLSRILPRLQVRTTNSVKSSHAHILNLNRSFQSVAGRHGVLL